MGAQAAALQLAGCWGEAAGATGRPEGRLSSARARGAGPRTEEEATLSLSGPGPGARPEGSQPDVPGPECPRRASGRGHQSSRPPPGGVLSLPGLTCTGRPALRCGGVCATRAPPPAASGAGAGPPAALGLTGLPAALSLTGPPAAPGRVA